RPRVLPRLRFAHGVSAATIVLIFLAMHLVNYLTGLWSELCRARAPLLEPFPARELLQQQRLELLEPLAVAAHLLAGQPIIIGRTHARVELRLLALQCLDLLREGCELALLVIAQAYSSLGGCCVGRTPPCGPRRRHLPSRIRAAGCRRRPLL